MAPLTSLTACVIYILSVVHSSEPVQELPKCTGNRAIAENVRRTLAEEVLLAMPKQPGLVYDCQLEYDGYQYMGTTYAWGDIMFGRPAIFFER
ncbi:hypothetical protein ANCCAN_10043 [Ancylostoma caninum]|uniref:Uncharacterized protein n=1 Tax=Ancylostoma caninum TaxID=29170 RepID=A0A368GJT0_ANCCA|nr:hypothetical protein ANCCAN_10043 [Ancylostoma caninum]